MTIRDYSKGKVYKIIANDAPDEKVYVGSTTKDYLSQRMTAHRALYLQWKKGKVKDMHAMVYELFDKYGIENCSIILLENVECKSKDELLAREKYYYLTLNCINKKSPINTMEEQAQKDREYYHLNKDHYKKYREENKDRISETKKNYYLKNQEKLKEASRINGKKRYSEENKEKQKEKRKEMYLKRKEKIQEYYELNKDRIKDYKKQHHLNSKIKNEVVMCACGGSCQKSSIRRHEKTKLHLDFLKANELP